MSALAEYITMTTERGSCECGKCFDAPEVSVQPVGPHTADLTFFQVRAKEKPEPRADELKHLIEIQNEEPAFGDPIDLFHGKEHNFIDIGAWIGDQGLGLMLMGLGHVLGLWALLTPNNMMPSLPDSLKKQMAGMGMVSIQVEKKGEEE